MFEYKSLSALLLELQRENGTLKFELIKQQSDLDYIAMMTDVDLGEDDVNE